jgi:Mn-dependent DtxR family transcriptional regulator
MTAGYVPSGKPPIDPYAPVPTAKANGVRGANGSPYSEFRERQADEAGFVRCMTADEFFAVESAANLVVPALGICPGPPTGLVGQAYVGKTIVALAAGMAVALGRELWGTWRVQQGAWLHLDYEQGRRHTKARVRRLARAFGVSDDEVRALIATGIIRIAVHPELRLTTAKAADHYTRAFEGVRFVTCDSLRPMLGGVDENSSQVRAMLGVLSLASDRSGAAVALIHHGGKTPLQGERARKETPRGSSGIVDEFQSLFVMTKKKGDPVALVTHEKDRELGEPAADFGLRIDDVADERDPKWGLRVSHVDCEQMGAAKETHDGRFLKALAAARDCIRDNPGIAGIGAVAERLGVRRTAVSAAVNQLIADGVVTPTTAPKNGTRLYLSHAVPTEAA